MKFVIKRARRGVLRRNQWTFVLVAANGETVAVGETYNNASDCAATVDRIIREIESGAVSAEWLD